MLEVKAPSDFTAMLTVLTCKSCIVVSYHLYLTGQCIGSLSLY